MWEIIALAAVAIIAVAVAATVIAVKSVRIIGHSVQKIVQKALDHITVAGDPLAAPRLADLEAERMKWAMKKAEELGPDTGEVEDWR